MSSKTAMIEGPTSVGSIVKSTPFSVSSLYSFSTSADKNWVAGMPSALSAAGVVLGRRVGLRLEEELRISLTFSIGHREPPKVSVGHIVLDSKAERIDIEVVRASNVIDRY